MFCNEISKKLTHKSKICKDVFKKTKDENMYIPVMLTEGNFRLFYSQLCGQPKVIISSALAVLLMYVHSERLCLKFY